MSWQPTAPIEHLRVRAEALASTRAFFAARQVMEVETPALVRHGVTDIHLHSAQVNLPGHAAPLYLHTSPEYAMKRLLAAGSGDIYQIAHVFRGDEVSRLHNPEFTLIEWYRCGHTMSQLMQEVAELATLLLVLPPGPYESLSYAQAFERWLQCNPLEMTPESLRTLAVARGLTAPLAERCTRDELLDWLMACIVGPALGATQLCFVHHYPASQAALARLDPTDARVALRFELYYRGVELANGFEELSDAHEQRRRFEHDLGERVRRRLPLLPIDQALLEALEHGLPAVSGVALGFDRLLLLRLGAEALSEVIAFPLERA